MECFTCRSRIFGEEYPGTAYLWSPRGRHRPLHQHSPRRNHRLRNPWYIPSLPVSNNSSHPPQSNTISPPRNHKPHQLFDQHLQPPQQRSLHPLPPLQNNNLNPTTLCRCRPPLEKRTGGKYEGGTGEGGIEVRAFGLESWVDD